MGQRFMQELGCRNIKYVIINRSWKDRFDKAVRAIERNIFHKSNN